MQVWTDLTLIYCSAFSVFLLIHSPDHGREEEADKQMLTVMRNISDKDEMSKKMNLLTSYLFGLWSVIGVDRVMLPLFLLCSKEVFRRLRLFPEVL